MFMHSYLLSQYSLFIILLIWLPIAYFGSKNEKYNENNAWTSFCF